MSLNIKSTIFGLLTIAFSAMPTVAQQRQLPAQHNAQHETLMANRRPVNAAINQKVDERTAKAVADREELDEIYNLCWNSQSVNPYGGVAIPQTKEINVAEGVVPVKGRVSSKYGWRPQFGRMHRGVDLSLNVGDTVRAAFSGKVRLCKFEGKGYGYYVVIRHDNGMETVYGHLSRFIVKPDQRVRAGEPIALGGNTGRSTGPHLHFETRYMGLPVNPEGIFDFEHKTTHKDVYTFSKASYEKAQVHGPRKSSAPTASVSKASASSKQSAKRQSKRRR